MALTRSRFVMGSFGSTRVRSRPGSVSCTGLVKNDAKGVRSFATAPGMVSREWGSPTPDDAVVPMNGARAGKVGSSISKLIQHWRANIRLGASSCLA